MECWDWEKSGKHQFIGSVKVTFNELQSQKDFEFQNAKKKHPGILKVEQAALFIKPTFLDYLRGGLQLNLMVAIDFTGSNGIPSNASSLHFMNPNALNQYQQAIVSVGEIVLPYDYDQRVPCFGFGAKTMFPNFSSGQVLHCFPLSGNPQNVEGYGLQNIMDLYRYAL